MRAIEGEIMHGLVDLLTKLQGRTAELHLLFTSSSALMVPVRKNCTSNQKLACFAAFCALSQTVNTFLKNNMHLRLSGFWFIDQNNILTVLIHELETAPFSSIPPNAVSTILDPRYHPVGPKREHKTRRPTQAYRRAYRPIKTGILYFVNPETTYGWFCRARWQVTHKMCNFIFCIHNNTFEKKNHLVHVLTRLIKCKLR